MATDIAQTVDRTLLALLHLADTGPQSIRQIAASLAISLTAARRIVVTLHREGMLRRTEDRRYDLGPRLIRMTDPLLARFAELAGPSMAALARHTGLSVLLSAFAADGVCVLHQADPAPPGLRLDYRTGRWRPMTDCADGLVILAHLSGARRERIVRDSGRPGLPQQLERVREQGHLFAAGEPWGAAALSVPILDTRIGVIGALTVLGAAAEAPGAGLLHALSAASGEIAGAVLRQSSERAG